MSFGGETGNSVCMGKACGAGVPRWISPAAGAALASVLALALAAPARAQTPPAEPKKDAPAEPPPSEVSVPRGASGAVIVPPKEEPAPPPPAAPVLTPPKVLKDDGAAYPEQALKDGVTETVTVVVIVEIDPAGAVKKATVETAAGHGFDEAAVEAAKKLVFEPATRNGQPIASKIKHTYEFAPPQARFVGRVLFQTGGAIAGATITVRGPDGKDVEATTRADGTFELPDLPAGKYHVTVKAAGVVAQDADEELHPGEEARIVFRMTRNGEAASGERAPDEDVEEVTVKGTRPAREVTRRTLEQREMSRIPGTNGDALRSIQNLPGVARPPGLAGLLIIRGSAPQDTNIFVDGTLIPLVYHFGGLSSVIPTEMLEKIDFYPGNFSTQYGRVMGGIVDVNVRDPKKDKLHGLAQVDLIDARVLAEGPVGGGWNFMVGGRRSYVDVWLKPVLEQTGAGVTTAPVYYDYQAMLQKDLSKTSSFRVMLYGADDRLDVLIKSVNATEPGLTGGISAHTGFWRAQAQYKNKFTEATQFKLTSAIGQDMVDFTLGDNFFRLTSVPITTRAEISQKLTQGIVNNLGLDVLYAPYRVDVRFPPFPRPGEPPSGPFLSRPSLETTDKDAIYRPALYEELEITPWKGGRIVPGVRLDYAKDTRAWDVQPRATARQEIVSEFPKTAIKGGAGLFSQPPQPQETNAVFGIPGLTSNRAYHYDLGVEQELTRNIDMSLEGFYKQLDNLVTNKIGNVGRGHVYGLETLVRYRPDARFFGWLAYTLSRSVRRDTPQEPERLSMFDQTHILTVLGSYRLGRGWEIGGRFRLVSGNLYSPQTYGFFDQNAGAYLPLVAYPPNGTRLPMFTQLDVRVDKTWKFKAWTLSAYLDVQNVYNAGNVEGTSYNYNSTRSTYATGLPILPILGVRGEL